MELVIMDTITDIRMKICLVGDACVGKTSLIRRYVLDMFSDKYIATFGTKISKKKVQLKHEDRDLKVTLMIWDIIGQKEFRELVKEAYFYGANGAIVVCDITRKETLEELKGWIKGLFDVTGKIPLVFLGNKADMADKAAFTKAELDMFAAVYNAPAFLTSAKNGDNVEKAFETITQRLMEKGL